MITPLLHARKRSLAGTVLMATLTMMSVIGFQATQPVYAAGMNTPPKPFAAGTVVRTASCAQPPAQAAKDRATYTPQELQQYGLPPRTPGESFTHWATVVRTATKRVCDRTVTNVRNPVYNTSDLSYTNWGGNIADLGRSGTTVYSEIDMDYYEPCPNNANDSWESMWVGLGGVYNSNLVQTGTRVHRYWNGSTWVNEHKAWVENLGDSQNPSENDLFNIACNDHMYVKVWGGDCMFVEDLNTGVNSGNQCYGPSANSESAEAIAERPLINGSLPLLADFHTETFYGVGITYNGYYDPMSSVPHDYSNMESQYGSYDLTTTGPIQNDPGDVPYDEFSQTWDNLE